MKLSLLLTCLLASFHLALAQKVYEEKQIEVALRMIGHQTLLNAGDSTSRVLPISRDENSYRISFESHLEIQPADLVVSVEEVLKNMGMLAGYIVEVEDCESKEVVYSFQMAELGQEELIPCMGRKLPYGCYSILLNLSNSATISSMPEGARSSRIHERIGLMNILGALLFLLLLGSGAYLLIIRRDKAQKKEHIIALGKYSFDTRNDELIINGQRTELTAKESDLLLLLYGMQNSTVEREEILSKVWGDVGDYIGRTLDVFISKLRKKLEADPNIKITNVRGVGYKLIVNA